MSTPQRTNESANSTATQPATPHTAGTIRLAPTPEEIQLQQAQLQLDQNEAPPRTGWARIIENSIVRVLVLSLFSFSGVLFMIFVAWVGNTVFGTRA